MLRTFHDRIEFYSESSLRDALFDNHVFTNDYFRSGYEDVSAYALKYAKENGLSRIVEMGAGTAPLTEILAETPEANDLTLIPCDRTPHVPLYEEMKEKYSNVEPVMDSVDFVHEHDFGPSALLLILGAFPAVPEEDRPAALKALTASSDRVMVWEYVRHSPFSMFLASLTFFVALILPLAWIGRPGRLRRFFWCWILPVVPVLAATDGVLWCLRAWTNKQWSKNLEATVKPVAPNRPPKIQSWPNSQVVIW